MLPTRTRECEKRGRACELVQLKLDGSNEVFTARMSGRGVAVMLVDEPVGATRSHDAQGHEGRPVRVTTSSQDAKSKIRPVRKSSK